MQQTTNYALKKIELNDSPPDITVINPNWDTIDTELKENADALTTHLADYVKHPGISATSGTSKAYTVTLDPAPLDIPEFFGITIIPHVTNVASPTLTINGIGTIALKDQKGVAYAAGKLLAGKPYSFRKVGSDFLADSGSGGGGNLQPNQALAGFTFVNDEGEQVGLGDVDLIPVNIKKGVNIFGVVGTLAGIEAGNLKVYDVYNVTMQTNQTTPVPSISSLKVTLEGTYRLKYRLSKMGSAGLVCTVYGQIYINGVPNGILRSITSSTAGEYIDYTEDFTLKPTDIVRIYAWTSGTTYPTSYTQIREVLINLGFTEQK
ncbi:hypothetical protein [Psychrobacillus sp. BM2]|uniref:hypothetical protein n=1 Tax=Psychrobacillus sp. BM2 TaxID=3400421 RepID=UPI003B01757F